MYTTEPKLPIASSHPQPQSTTPYPSKSIASRTVARGNLTRRKVFLLSLLALCLLCMTKTFFKSFPDIGIDTTGLGFGGYTEGSPISNGRPRTEVVDFDFDFDFEYDGDDGFVWKDLRRRGDEEGKEGGPEGQREDSSMENISSGDSVQEQDNKNQAEDQLENEKETLVRNHQTNPDATQSVLIQEKSSSNYQQLNFPSQKFLQTQSPIENWGLGRISHRVAGANDYVYDESAGEDTWAYIVDTGVFGDHEQFDNGRAKHEGFNGVKNGGDTEDHYGHGTVIAGIIAGSRDGVSKKANIIPVKVLNDMGGGTTSQVLEGIQWAYHDAQVNGRLGKSVLHFSLGGGYSPVLNNAVTAAVKGGLMVVVAAGRSNSDISNFSPQSAPGALVVGSSTHTDTRAYFSNYGESVRIHAPGISITTTWIPSRPGSNNDTIIFHGTTTSAAFVSGVALYLMRLLLEEMK